MPKLPSLRRIREERLLSQRELGERAGISHVTIRNIERGLHEPRLSTVRKIAETLGVSGKELMQEDTTAKEAAA